MKNTTLNKFIIADKYNRSIKEEVTKKIIAERLAEMIAENLKKEK